MDIGVKALLGVSTALWLMPGVAMAQPASAGLDPTSTNPPAPAPAEQQSGATASGVADIIVTATRRATNLQKVAATIDVASSQKLDAVNVHEAGGLDKLVSGVTIARSGGVTPFIRGIGTFNAGFSEASVAQYVDGVFLPNSAGALFSFNNIERIEVLKGPQGTLYGRNTTGGLINVITRAPSDQLTMDASLGYANYNTFTQNFYGSAPITSTISANIAVFHEKQSDGWSKNVFTGDDTQKSDETGVYAKVRWEPRSSTKVTLSGLYNYSNSSKGWAFAIYPGTSGLDGTPYLGQYRISQRADPNARFRSYMGALRIDQDLGFAEFFSLSAFQYGKEGSFLSQNGVAGGFVPGAAQTSANLRSAQEVKIDFDYNTFSQEFQLSSKSGSPFEWVAGAFYYHDNTNVATALTSTCVGTVCAPVAGGVPRITHTRPTTRSYSGYADGTYNVREGTRLTAGVRYTYEKKGFDGFSEPVLGRPDSSPNAPLVFPPTTLDLSRTFPKLTYRAVLAQDFTDQVRGYISYNRGFKSGNYNPNSLTNPAVKPEILDAYEVGIKSELFDRVLRLNLSGFWYDYKDIQVRSNQGQPVGAPSIAQNIASARAKGVDGQIDIVPTAGLAISGGFEYLDSKYRDYPGATCVAPRPQPFPAGVLGGGVIIGCQPGSAVGTPGYTNLEGFRLPLSPKWSGTLNVSYSLETEVGQFTLVGNDSYKSRFSFTPEHSIIQKAYQTVDASLTWTTVNKRFDVRGYISNIFDKYHYVAGQGTINGFVYVPGAPRTYGVVVGAHF